jgi:hypothetical protein
VALGGLENADVRNKSILYKVKAKGRALFICSQLTGCPIHNTSTINARVSPFFLQKSFKRFNRQ